MSSRDETIKWMVEECQPPRSEDKRQWIVSDNLDRTYPAVPNWRDCIEAEAANEPSPAECMQVLEASKAHRVRDWQQGGKPAPPALLIPSLPTTPEDFTTWLKAETIDWGERCFRYPANSVNFRSVTFQRFHHGKWFYDDDLYWHEGDIGTVRWWADKQYGEVVEGVETWTESASAPMPALLKFNCLKTGNQLAQHIQVRIEAFDSWVWRFFWTHYLELLNDIGQTWRESRGAIDKHLEGLGIVAIKWGQEDDATTRTPRRPGKPGLDHKEQVKRVALASRAEQVRAKHPELTWPQIAARIGWHLGCKPNSTGIKLLEDARHRLARLRGSDPDGLLNEAAAWLKERQKEKKT